MYRSLLTPWHESSGAKWEPWLDTEVVAYYGETRESPPGQANELALVDLSPLPRIGIKGAEHDRWLRGRRYTISQSLNSATLQDDGSIIARLSRNELLWISNIGVPVAPHDLTNPDARCFLLPRQDSHVELMMTGRRVAELMAKICGVDLSPSAFRNLDVAQTSVAKTGAIVIRADVDELPGFRILVDSASARYFWTVLLDAMREYGGRVLGFRDLRRDSSHSHRRGDRTAEID